MPNVEPGSKLQGYYRGYAIYERQGWFTAYYEGQYVSRSNSHSAVQTACDDHATKCTQPR